MPHLILEYTGNLSPARPFKAVFTELHSILSDHGIAIENCKSRAIPLETFLVSDGSKDSAFVHLDVRFLSGRTAGIKTKIAGQMLETLVRSFPGHQTTHLQITVEIGDIDRRFYMKFPDNLK